MYVCDTDKTKKPNYIPTLERSSQYKAVWKRHWKEFVNQYDRRFKAIYGKLTGEKIEEVEKLLGCGDFLNGFQRYSCEECDINLIVPFSCKSRLCLSCYRKKLFGWSINLSHILNIDLRHIHVTFTIPGTVSNLLFQRRGEAEDMISVAAEVYKKELIKFARLKFKKEDITISDKVWLPGSIATLHKCGNSLNFNPHIHLVGTTAIIHKETKEVLNLSFLRYKKFAFSWMMAFCKHYEKEKVITKAESLVIQNKYKNGFHVYFQPIAGEEKEPLFRTAEYIASGFFHNSQIQKVDDDKKEITFRYKSWVERSTREKVFQEQRIDVYEFMAKMLFFLPDPNRKMIRYYGIYANRIKEKLEFIEQRTWAQAIENSFDAKPQHCPDCAKKMQLTIVYSYSARKTMEGLRKTYSYNNGYFRPKARPP
ncbi:MAG TPA: transposase [Leptospiraceae bacterium]|nr:transposase [Leptospiraceae bacterium]